jgi:cell division protein ZapA
MGQVSVPVNGRAYAITCDDGQETRIRRLAQYVDAKVAQFVGSVGQVGEARLLLLAALVIADELSDANDALERERSRAENGSNGRDETAGLVAPIAAGLQTP